MIPTEAEIHRQGFSHAPVILHRVCLNDAGDVGSGHCGVDAVGGDIAEQVVNQRGAGILTGKTECAVRITRLAEVVRPPPNIDSELQVVPPALPGEVVDKLVDAVGAVTRPDVA